MNPTMALRRGQHARLRSAGGIAALLALVFLAACGNAANNGSTAAHNHPAGDGVGWEHIHGLGLDPADDVLYAATHTGVYRLESGSEPTRVADRCQDTMGFLVVGPNRFLASGHPDLREDLPSRLGLIESTDAGVRWRSRSLSGTADFHALRMMGDRVYGFDSVSGRLLATDDLVTWQLLAQLPLLDFAVDSSDSAQLLATSASGLQRSRDGGTTFAAAGGTPALELLSWPQPDRLYGTTATGDLWRSTDAGISWSWTARTAGKPAALFAPSADELYVATDHGIYESTDAGATFTTLYELTTRR